jgi:hypothetical protein
MDFLLSELLGGVHAAWLISGEAVNERIIAKARFETSQFCKRASPCSRQPKLHAAEDCSTLADFPVGTEHPAFDVGFRGLRCQPSFGRIGDYSSAGTE